MSSVREKKLYEVCKQPNRGNLTYYSPPYGGGAGGGATRFAGEAAVISVREGTVLLFYHVTFLSPNNALHDTKKVTNLSHHRLFTCLITRYKDR